MIAKPMDSAAPKREPGTDSHLPSLDGLRAVSIVLVLLGHLNGTQGFPRINLQIGDYSHLGVVVFFVISGFLITRLLLSEHAKRGRISLQLFYARRALRLFPASYAFIACVAILWWAGLVDLHAGDLWHAVTYTMNYSVSRSWWVGHLWSLSVEEQFYLLWPFAFLAAGPRRSTWVAAAVIGLGPVTRIAARLFLNGSPYKDLEMFPMVADSLATGCLLAQVSGWLEGQTWYLRLFRPLYSLGLLALICVINRYMGRTIVWVFGTAILNLSLAILIHRCVYYSRDWAGQVLNWKPIAFVGLLSYSLYLWQQLFLNRNSAAWVNAFPQNLTFAVAAALASYYLLEKPLLRLRHRLRA
jgi:peptidoglycan/LPS O-acetylase OafA/YrhL